MEDLCALYKDDNDATFIKDLAIIILRKVRRSLFILTISRSFGVIQLIIDEVAKRMRML